MYFGKSGLAGRVGPMYDVLDGPDLHHGKGQNLGEYDNAM